MYWLLIPAAIAAIVLAIAYYTYRICFYSPQNRLEDPYSVMDGEQYAAVSDSILKCTRIMDSIPCEWVSIESYDGTRLSGRYYHMSDHAPVQLLLHGYRSMALRDCAGGHILARKMGFNILVADQRAHAKSEGKVISFGVRERKDCLCWVNYISQRFGNNRPIILSGLSMGAATVLMASELELPENVVAIMADCPYSSPSDIIRKVSVDMRYPAKLSYPFIWLGGLVFGGFKLTDSAAVQAVRNAKIPILLIHGEDDLFVPCDMSREIFKACASRAELHTFPGAGHGLSYMVDPMRYEDISVRFLWSIPELKEHLSQNAFTQEKLGMA